MLKPRVIASVCLKNNHVVQSIGFNRYLPIGALDITLEYLDRWGIDEIVLLDLDATKEDRLIDLELIQKSVRNIQTPVTIGGGIKSLQDVDKVIKAGADKVTLNTSFLKNPELLKEAVNHFGVQCLIASIDAKKEGNSYYAFNRHIESSSKNEISALLNLAETYGAGEIFLNSVDNDGKKSGFDIDLFNYSKEKTSIPIILCGGAGNAHHFLEASQAGARSLCAGNFFHFTEQSVITTKQYLKQNGIGVRLESQTKYDKAEFLNGTYRVKNQPEAVLEKMKFEYFQDEQI
jgi:cyclase